MSALSFTNWLRPGLTTQPSFRTSCRLRGEMDLPGVIWGLLDGTFLLARPNTQVEYIFGTPAGRLTFDNAAARAIVMALAAGPCRLRDIVEQGGVTPMDVIANAMVLCASTQIRPVEPTRANVAPMNAVILRRLGCPEEVTYLALPLSASQVCCAARKPIPVSWPHRLQRRYVHHAGPHSRCSNRQPQVREDSGPNGSRSEQRDLGRHLQPPAGNLSAQHHACQYVRPGRRDLLCRHIADAHDGAAAGREHDRLRILRDLRRAHRSHHDLSSLSPDDSHQCLPSPTNARSREEGAHRNTGRHVDGVAQAVHDRPQVSQGRYLDEEG